MAAAAPGSSARSSAGWSCSAGPWSSPPRRSSVPSTRAPHTGTTRTSTGCGTSAPRAAARRATTCTWSRRSTPSTRSSAIPAAAGARRASGAPAGSEGGSAAQLQRGDDRLVRREPRQLRPVLGVDPPDVVVVDERRGGARGDPRAPHPQAQGPVDGPVPDERAGYACAHDEPDAELLADLAVQRRHRSLPGLDLPAGQLPPTGQRGRRRPTGGEQQTWRGEVVDDRGGDDEAVAAHPRTGSLVTPRGYRCRGGQGCRRAGTMTGWR